MARVGRLGRYRQLEKRIAASDSGGIFDRWRWGLRLLHDATRVTKNGNLKHGVLDEFKADGLGEREVQWRLACARAYPTEVQIRNAVTDLKSWHELVRAGFPPYEAPPGEPLADPRDSDERARDMARELSELAGDQMSLFPDDTFGPVSTLEELAKYAEEMRTLTERFAQRDVERAAYIARLVAAAGGDMSTTWEQAERLLRREDPEDDQDRETA